MPPLSTLHSPLANLEKQILATIVYYDIINYPLTGLEVFSCLINNKSDKRDKAEGASENSLYDIIEFLDKSNFLRENIGQKFGFYFLKGREEIVNERLYRKKIADRKWKKARRILWIMQIAPFIKALFMSGSLAMGNCKKSSDIDIFIVAKKGRIWTVRVFATLIAALLGARRHGNFTKDKICLNHYITDKSLTIPFESLYNAQSYVHLVNIYNGEEEKRLFKKFQKENRWIKSYLKNYKFSKLASIRSIKKSKSLAFLAKVFEITLGGKFGDYFERKLSWIQRNKIKKDPLCLKKGGRITVNDDQLEFHPDSHESRVIPQFNIKAKQLGLYEFDKQKDSGLN